MRNTTTIKISYIQYLVRNYTTTTTTLIGKKNQKELISFCKRKSLAFVLLWKKYLDNMFFSPDFIPLFQRRGPRVNIENLV